MNINTNKQFISEEINELQKKATDVFNSYKNLNLQEKIDIIAQAFGCRTGHIYTTPCVGKWRGTNDVRIRFDNNVSLSIGNGLTPKTKTIKRQTEYVNSALALYNPEIVKTKKEMALSVLLEKEKIDREVAIKMGLKSYEVLSVEFVNAIDCEKVDGYLGWYYIVLAIDGKIRIHLETGLNYNISIGNVSPKQKRANYFVAGGLDNNEVDYVFDNTGFSTKSHLYTMPVPDCVLERANKELLKHISAT